MSGQRTIRHALCAALALAALLLAAGPAGAISRAAPGRETAIVTSANLRLRAGPGTAFAVIATLPAGTRLAIVERSGAWLKARLDDGTVGWVNDAYLRLCGAGETASRARALVPTLNLRAAAASDAPVLGRIAAGTSFAVIGRSDDGAWLNVRLDDGTTGWLSAALTDDCGAPPAPTPAPATPTPAATPTAAPAQAAAKDEPWLRFAPASSGWVATPDATDPLRLTIAPDRPALGEQRILVLFTNPSSAYDTAMSKIADTFIAKKLNVSFTVINMESDTGRGLATLRGAAGAGYRLIFAMGSRAAAFVHEHYRGGPLPVVTVCAKDPVLLGQMPDYQHGSGGNIAYTSLNVPIEVQMAYLAELAPGLKTIGVLYAASNDSAIETQVKPLKRVAAARGIAVVDVVVEDDRRAREELAEKMPRAAAALAAGDPGGRQSLFWITGSTSVFNEIATIDRYAGRVPVLSAVPDVVREGDDSAILSIGVSFESNAYLAALYGADILAGSARAGDLPVGVVSPPDIAINVRKARAIGLRVPFSFFESASTVYDEQGRAVRRAGRVLQ